VSSEAPAPPLTPTERAGERAARNTAVQAIAEVVGKLSSLALIVYLGRSVGPSDLGIFVFAVAYLQIVVMPIDLGLERYVLRLIAKDREEIRHAFMGALAVKATIACAVVPLSLLVLAAIGKGSGTVFATVGILMVGYLLDSAGRVITSVFMAYERNELQAITIVVQRVGTAAVGIVLLALGFGIVVVAGAFALGSAVTLTVAVVLFRVRLAPPKLEFDPEKARPMALRSIPFAADDVLTVLLFKLDAVLLSVMATNAATGNYGAAYRLFEATLSVNYSLSAAFAAMFAYLGHDTEPTISAVFQRAIKLAMVALVPCAAVFGVLADPLVRTLFGDGLASAADPLRLLAPAQIELGVVTLCSVLIVSRRRPSIMAVATAGAVILNVVLNVMLIPRLKENGAAAAMLITETAFVVLVVALATRETGRLGLRATLVGPIVAGAAMVGVMFGLEHFLAAALAAGVACYLAVLVVVERLVAPEDVSFVTSLVRRRLGLRPRVAG
jgi:O-antigen/teichoic acid export membrane protein